jgi:hypothetical protein
VQGRGHGQEGGDGHEHVTGRGEGVQGDVRDYSFHQVNFLFWQSVGLALVR